MEELLVKRAQRGDDDALTQLIEEHIYVVERFAYQLGVTPSEVEDVTQEVFIKVYRYLDRFERGKFTTWLYSITLNVVKDFYRHEKSQRRKKQAFESVAKGKTDTIPLIDEQSQTLHEYIQNLDETYKIPVILHYFHGLSFQEIAEILELTEGAVKSRMMRARQQLKAMYGKVGEK